MLPGLIGVIGFLLAYALVASGRLVASTRVILGLIVLLSLGVGALEEIAEYSSDMLLAPRLPGWHHFQGNAQEDPWHDTMNDLVADLVGAAFGALLGRWLLDQTRRHHAARLPALITELTAMFESDRPPPASG